MCRWWSRRRPQLAVRNHAVNQTDRSTSSASIRSTGGIRMRTPPGASASTPPALLSLRVGGGSQRYLMRHLDRGTNEYWARYAV
jgi:hypothetical protein